MSHFYESQTPEDLPRSHQGEYWPDESDETEASDTALTDYLGGRQPLLEPIEALLSGQKDDK